MVVQNTMGTLYIAIRLGHLLRSTAVAFFKARLPSHVFYGTIDYKYHGRNDLI